MKSLVDPNLFHDKMSGFLYPARRLVKRNYPMVSKDEYVSTLEYFRADSG